MKFKIKSGKNREIRLNMDAINTYASRWKPGTEFKIEIVRRQAKKSDPMRKYYFSSVAKPYGEHLGYDADEILLLHRQLKIVYFQVQPDAKGIYRNKDIPSVFGNDSALPIDEKVKFLDWVTRKAAKDGVYIQPPA